MPGRWLGVERPHRLMTAPAPRQRRAFHPALLAPPRGVTAPIRLAAPAFVADLLMTNAPADLAGAPHASCAPSVAGRHR